MSENLITVATYYNPKNAHLARILLARSGIQAILLDENYAHISPHHFTGVRLQVSENQAQLAHTILWGKSTTGKLRCGACDSEHIEINRPWWVPWIFALSIMTMLPLGRSIVKVRCQDCGHLGPASKPHEETSSNG